MLNNCSTKFKEILQNTSTVTRRPKKNKVVGITELLQG